MDVIFRPLERVRKIIECTGLEVTYAYEDLVFAEHSVFLFRFDDENQNHAFLYFNQECNVEHAKLLEEQMKEQARLDTFTITNAGVFCVEQKEETEEINIVFNPK